MALNPNVFTTLANFKEFLGIIVTTNDTLLEKLLDQSTDFIETQTGRKFLDQGSDITEFHDGDVFHTNVNKIFVQNYPIISITSIASRTGDLASPTFTNFNINDFIAENDTGTIYFRSKTILSTGTILVPDRQNIRVIYRGGFALANIPNDLILAVHLQGAKLFSRRQSQGVKNEKVGTASVTWDNEKENELKEIIQSFKRYS